MSVRRRNFLTAMGLGAGSLFLPSLSRRARASGTPPTRFVLMYSAQGTVPDRWSTNPTNQPADQSWVEDMAGWSMGEMGEILAPLHAYRSQISVVDGLGLVSAEADGSGFRHERAQAHSLTGANAAWVGGFPYAGDATIDQVIADVVARPDRYRSLELSVGGGLSYDGYGSVIYRGRNQPLPVIDDPRLLWDRLFGAGMNGPIQDNQASVLDALSERYGALAGQLNPVDQQKLDAHRELIHALESQIVGLAEAGCDDVPARPETHGDYDTDFAAQLGMATVALSCDLTRVVSFQMGQLTNAQLGAPPGDVHADFAHGIYDSQEASDVMTAYGNYHASHFAQILAALEAIPEGEGTLLDSTLVVWMSEMADSWHGFDRYPVVVGGGGGACLRLGRYVHFPRSTPYQGLQYDQYPTMGLPHQRFLVSLCQAMGLPINAMPITELYNAMGERIDCSGPITELLA